MAKKFKDYYDLEYIEMLSNKIFEVKKDFDKNKFKKFLSNLETLEFLERQDLISEALKKVLGNEYSNNLKIFTNILGEELKDPEGMFTFGYWIWPIGRYVEKNALKDFDASMDFIYLMTKRFTGEFAIRTLIRANPKKALKTLIDWSKDESVHVRRLASEGIRISLPWSKKLFEAVNEFDLFKQILTNLKNDKFKFVQKSVGNNLNDLMKFDSAKANLIINEWLKDNPSKETLWIIKHGSRSLKKIKSSFFK